MPTPKKPNSTRPDVSVKRRHVAQVIRELLGFSYEDAEAFIDIVFEELARAMVKYGYVTVDGFGTFQVTNSKNTWVRFKAAAGIKKAIREGPDSVKFIRIDPVTGIYDENVDYVFEKNINEELTKET